ncbi:MAG: hypothetical protein EU535_06650 [Promethearchaeota archaeon]|nr:MAG: hypothetical protein EU535_06650 [Candidatus Lokiarchaeota archaeon]
MNDKNDLQCKNEHCTNSSIDYNEKNNNSYLLFLDIFEVKKSLKDYVNEQLQHYSKTGVRLFTTKDIIKVLRMKNESFKPEVLECIRNIFHRQEENKIQTIYEMIFGGIRMSYHSLKRRLPEGHKLMTTPHEWFDMVTYKYEYLKKKLIKTISYLPILIECDRNHVYIKHARDVKYGCKFCKSHKGGIVSQQAIEIDYEHIKSVCLSRGFDLISSQQEVETNLKQKRKSFEEERNIVVVVKHIHCDHEFEIKLRAIKNRPYCKFCISNKRQKIVQLFAEEMLGEKFEPEVQIHSVFDKENHKEVNQFDFRVKLDMYKKLKIKDKNGNFIKLAIERHGEQHEPTRKGFKQYLRISHHPDAKGGSKIYNKLWEKWMRQLEIDKKEVEIFQKSNEKGYYLIVVNHKIKNHQVEQYIMNELQRQTGYKINYKGIKWQTLFKKIK